ncbi:hypothetical protein GOP47_0011215 [Adiantum capillus-veneris]|uniref:Uncharacterized protein n=1 Tax=Adiantum capillus-veneris TaxID=13818 RepID=A0A9D4USU2_ADICA|nr:hypothetical protein GOP47_0011215 [Adiantum capillus-veneris]
MKVSQSQVAYAEFREPKLPIHGKLLHSVGCLNSSVTTSSQERGRPILEFSSLVGTATVNEVENLLHRWEVVFMSCNYSAKWFSDCCGDLAKVVSSMDRKREREGDALSAV